MLLPAGKLAMRALAASIAGLAVLIGVVAWLLSSGPVSLGFLTPYLKEALTLGRAGVYVELDDTILTWVEWDRTLDIRAIGLRLLNQDGQLIASVPEVSLGLSGRALLDRRVVPTTVDFLHPKVKLVRTRNGKIDLGMGTRIGAVAGDAAGAFVDKLLNPSPADRESGFLSQIRVLNADIVVVDRATRTTWRAPWADLTLQRTEGGVFGQLTADVEIGGAATRIVANGQFDGSTKAAAIELLLSDFEPARLGRHIDELAVLKAFKAPISGTLKAVVGADGLASDIEYDLAGGPGSVALPTFFEGSIVFSQMAARGQVLADLKTVRIDELFVDTGGPSGTANGIATIDLESDAFLTDGKIEGKFQDLPVDDLEEYWPPKLATVARDWVTANIRDGVVSKGIFKLNISGEEFASGILAPDSLELNIIFDGLSARYLENMPRLTGAKGTARMTADVLDIAVASGDIGNLVLTEGNVRVDGLSGETPSTEISFVASGPVADGLNALNAPPFEFAKIMNIDPADTAGRMAARARLAFPLSETIAPESVQFKAAANLRDFSLKSGIGEFPLEHGALVVRVDANGLDVEGSVSVANIPATVSWRKNFRGPEAQRTQLKMAIALDDEARQALKMPEIPWIKGPISVNADMVADGMVITSGRVSADLTKATVSLPELDWNKPADVKAKADVGFALSSTPEDVSVPRLALNFFVTGGGFEAQGQLDLNRDSTLKRLDLTQLKFGSSEVSASVRPQAPNGFIIALEGGQFDMRPYLSRIVGDGDDTRLPPLTLSARLRRMILSDDHVLDNMQGRAVYDGDSWKEMRAAGNIRGGAPIDVSLVSTKERRRISLRSSNGGDVMRGLGMFENAIGGDLKINATIEEAMPGRPVRGNLLMKNFRVVDSPTLARILRQGSLPKVASILGEKGIPFFQFATPFTMEKGQVRMLGARGVGPNLGVTLDGVIDRDREEVAMKGTLIPAYTINSVLGKIPFLGKLLVGGEGEGIFGLSYTVTGPITNPKVSVNPLSVLAPGPLRTLLFGITRPAIGKPKTEEKGN